ncbi:uncharacterized protein LOC108674790 [Hyalella azteca]|uniref:Uncharacterized protein LOC108674790 n=1 Tax=Hyalella azteca TaxID=294128 RepID=A0A8B7NZG7_HYAAZ|nr:uncharacterized protein LOC108674790 [Hyalella azteca]
MTTAVVLKDTFVKIGGYPDPSWCKLSSDQAADHQRGEITVAECAGKCLSNAACRIFCVSPGLTMCDLYSTLMTVDFIGFGANLYQSCYSSWAHKFNLITPNMTVMSSAPFSPNFKGLMTIDGYCCDFEMGYRFISNNAPTNFLNVDFGKVVTIEELRIAAFYGYFQGIEIRFGSSSNIATNLQISVVYGASNGDNRIYVKPPATGRYLTLKKNDYGAMDVCEMQAIPPKL